MHTSLALISMRGQASKCAIADADKLLAVKQLTFAGLLAPSSPQSSQPLLPKLLEFLVMPPALLVVAAFEGGGGTYARPSASALIFSR